MQKQNRPPVQFASGREFAGDSERKTGVYTGAHEDLSTESTHKLPAEVELGRRSIGAIMLVAATCIGGGTIALPMVLGKIGILPSIAFMLLMWLIVYCTAIINLELHLQAGQSMSLGKLSRKFSGKFLENITNICFKLLSYALLAVYIYGGSSILQSMLNWQSSTEISYLYAIAAFLLLMCPLALIDYVNRLLFMGLLASIAILIIGLVSEIKLDHLPIISSSFTNISAWEMIIPLVFTAFGFQGSIPTFVRYCDNDEKVLKKVFFWGTLIPAIVYIIWICSILAAIHANNYDFYQKIITSKVEVGELIKEISQIAKLNAVQTLIWWLSLLAIVTSLIGVGIGLYDSIQSMIVKKIPSPIMNKITTSVLTIFPAYLVAILIPNAFIKVLGFAGMILVVIAIFIPAYLLSKTNKPICKELKTPALVNFTVVCGIIIVLCEIINML